MSKTSGWNLPPGVFDNDPHFNQTEPKYDLEEIKAYMKELEEAIGAIEDASHFLFSEKIINEDYCLVTRQKVFGLYEEFEYIENDLKDEGYY